MAKTLQLQLGNFEESFFEDCILIGIQSQAAATLLCLEMERKLGLPFRRNLNSDIKIQFAAGKESGLGIAGTLFESVPIVSEIYFPLFKHKLSYGDSCIYIYSNHEDGFHLLPEYKQFNYLALIQDAGFTMHNQCLSYWLNQFDIINNCRIINIDEVGKHKENLII